MTTTHPVTGAPCESAECPYCGQTFYALPLHDPLKQHIDYCDKNPEAVDDNADPDVCSCGNPECRRTPNE